MLKYFDLEMEDGGHLAINDEYLKPYVASVLEFLDGVDYMNMLSFARSMMLSQEIKANNTIEGIMDDLSLIDKVINSKNDISLDVKKRIINLYHGYEYILSHNDINKDSLRDLYSILSSGLLNDFNIERTGKYYRTAPVYLYRGRRIDEYPMQGADFSKIDYYMDMYFDFVNSSDLSGIDGFIKSQVMHFYFVYVHPYMDLNGRTGRTTSMWYLVKNKNYPYIIFNRAIAFSQREYEKSIIKCRMRDEVTLFVKYVLQQVLLEFEKEHVIHNIQCNCPYELSNVDLQMIEYLLSTSSNLTALDLAQTYNNYNGRRKPWDIVSERIMPLIDKDVFVATPCGKAKEGKKTNLSLGLNGDLVSTSARSKIKHLKLDNYLR